MNTELVSNNLTHATGFGVNTETALAGANDLELWADDFIESLPTVADGELVARLRASEELHNLAFVLRGACALEITRRLKLTGQRIGPEMSRIAKDAGIEPSTLLYDRQIVETFGVEALRVAVLPRDMYRLALPMDDPQSVIEMAHNKRAENSGYSVEDFKADMQSLKGGAPKETVERGMWLHVHLDPETKRAWQELRKHRGLKDEVLMAQIIVESNDNHK